MEALSKRDMKKRKLVQKKGRKLLALASQVSDNTGLESAWHKKGRPTSRQWHRHAFQASQEKVRFTQGVRSGMTSEIPSI